MQRYNLIHGPEAEQAPKKCAILRTVDAYKYPNFHFDNSDEEK